MLKKESLALNKTLLSTQTVRKDDHHEKINSFAARRVDAADEPGLLQLEP